ncbi:DUF4333 domain-containing protein [Amycolatopsis sp. H20-H5]|uniref:DUF4333 domain-containing protein n=1 Tax=Amycolatopsis sp. H20-H5 TaxID=3046309 RepID=UPI002DBFB465|nr:DUF4333 domain-containing protein [Amycolatopsis sp. H20-H5]MEC3979363.1 DUF4333 domain-containing protein [Amycolatopsis sp. H20-H5]
MSTPYGGNDPQQQPQWGQQPQYGQQPGGAYPPSGPQQQPQWGQPGQPQQPQQPPQDQPQWGQPQQAPQQPQWGQQPGYPQQPPQQPYDPSQQQYGQPQQPYDPSQQQPQYGQQQPGGAYPPSGPQQVPYGQQQPGPPGQYDYSQYPGAPAEGEPKGKSKKGLLLGIGGLVVVIAAVCILGFVAPGFFKTEVFNNTQMQTDVQKVLTTDYKIEGVTGVTCPAEQEVKDGAKFECTATVAGKQQQVPITVKGTGGNYEVAPPATK